MDVTIVDDAINGNPKFAEKFNKDRTEPNSLKKALELQKDYDTKGKVVAKNYEGYMAIVNHPRFKDAPPGVLKSQVALQKRFEGLTFADGKVIKGRLTAPVVSGSNLKAFTEAWNKFISGPSAPKKAKVVSYAGLKKSLSLVISANAEVCQKVDELDKLVATDGSKEDIDAIVKYLETFQVQYDKKAFRSESVKIGQVCKDHALWDDYQEAYQIVEDSNGKKGYPEYRVIADQLLEFVKTAPPPQEVKSKRFEDEHPNHVSDDDEEDEVLGDEDEDEEDDEEFEVPDHVVIVEEKRKTRKDEDFTRKLFTLFSDIESRGTGNAIIANITPDRLFQGHIKVRQTGQIYIPELNFRFATEEEGRTYGDKVIAGLDNSERYEFVVSKI
jgi:hypothetical protein